MFNAMMTVRRRPPTLVSAADSPAGGDYCSSTFWTHTISWVTTFPFDQEYQIDVDMADDAPGTNWVSLATALSTVSGSNTIDATGINGVLTGGSPDTLYYRKYRVKLVRKSDAAVVSTQLTGQYTLQTYSDSC